MYHVLHYSPVIPPPFWTTFGKTCGHVQYIAGTAVVSLSSTKMPQYLPQVHACSVASHVVKCNVSYDATHTLSGGCQDY